MFEGQRFFNDILQSDLEVRYENTIEQLKNILEEIKSTNEHSEYDDFMKFIIERIIEVFKLKSEETRMKIISFEEGLNLNNEFYSKLNLSNYNTCYGNPKYCVEKFGDRYGQLISYLFTDLVKQLEYLFKGNLFKMCEYNELIISVYECTRDNEVEYIDLLNIINKHIKRSIKENELLKLVEEMDNNFRFYEEICRDYDGVNMLYLFKYGKYVSKEAIKFVETIEKLSESKIDELADVIVDAYLHSFISQNKARGSRDIVRITYVMGQEKVMKRVIEKFEDKGIKPHIYNVASDSINKQFEYDHRFDEAIYLDEEYARLREEAYRSICSEKKELLEKQSGLCGIMQFGEEPFVPVHIEEILSLTKKQLNIVKKMNISMTKIQDTYIPKGEISFSKSGLPSSQIGENFEEILNDFLDINMLDSRKYEQMQQLIIDELDKGNYIHVKGKEWNETDIVINMNKIKDREKETNFLNGGGDVNIPVGEVFTTPILKGTTGIFHVKEIYLKGYKFINLKLQFVDGNIVDYSCSNFFDDSKNRKYIEENLLYPYTTIPMGEFAIGSNTLAYVIAKKHNILDRLPILFIEKMGPHFAIGDPCYVWSEDNCIKNLLDEKEIVAKENEKTAKRHENINDAYTGIHIDITIPYDDIEFIKAITENNKEIFIIKDGKFQIDGTEELNEPLTKFAM